MVVRRKYEAGAGQVVKGGPSYDLNTVEDIRQGNLRRSYDPVRAPQAPTAPTSGVDVNWVYNPPTIPQAGYTEARGGVGFDAMYGGGIRISGDQLRNAFNPEYHSPAPPPDPNDVAKTVAAQRAFFAAERPYVRAEELNQASGAAQAQTLALQAQMDSLMLERNLALDRGLSQTARKYDEQIAAIQKQIGQFEVEAANTQGAANYLMQTMRDPMDLAKRAAEAIDTAGATAAMEAAVANLTQAKLESDERLQSALSEIGFEGLVGEIGIQAAQDMVAENALLNEQFGILEAQGAYQQEMADFQRDAAIAAADQIDAAFSKEVEAERMVASKKIRDALTAAQDDLNKVMAAKDEALQMVRDDVARAYGEGVQLPEQNEFIGMALQTAWNQVGADLNPDDFDVYAEWALQMMYDGVPMTTSAIAAYLEGLGQEFDDEDITIFRQMGVTASEARDEWRAVRERQGTQTDADNRDPYNIAEVERWKSTGEISGPYSERAAKVASIGDSLRQMGYEIEGDRFLRPVEWGGSNGRSVNSDHQTAGALDVYFRDGVKDEEYSRLMSMVDGWRRQGLVSSIVDLNGNQFHKDHVHISFALPYGGQKNFTAETREEKIYEDPTDNAPYAYNQPGNTVRIG